MAIKELAGQRFVHFARELIIRRRVDQLRNRLKTLGGCDPDAPQQYEELRTRYDFLSTQVSDMDAAALHPGRTGRETLLLNAGLLGCQTAGRTRCWNGG